MGNKQLVLNMEIELYHKIKDLVQKEKGKTGYKVTITGVINKILSDHFTKSK
jgi:hypothetical protein